MKQLSIKTFLLGAIFCFTTASAIKIEEVPSTTESIHHASRMEHSKEMAIPSNLMDSALGKALAFAKTQKLFTPTQLAQLFALTQGKNTAQLFTVLKQTHIDAHQLQLLIRILQAWERSLGGSVEELGLKNQLSKPSDTQKIRLVEEHKVLDADTKKIYVLHAIEVRIHTEKGYKWIPVGKFPFKALKQNDRFIHNGNSLYDMSLKEVKDFENLLKFVYQAVAAKKSSKIFKLDSKLTSNLFGKLWRGSKKAALRARKKDGDAFSVKSSRQQVEDILEYVREQLEKGTNEDKRHTAKTLIFIDPNECVDMAGFFDKFRAIGETITTRFGL